jgi:hypothetical protein
MQITTTDLVQFLAIFFNAIFGFLLLWLRAEIKALNVKIETLEKEISKLDEITEKLRNAKS